MIGSPDKMPLNSIIAKHLPKDIDFELISGEARLRRLLTGSRNIMAQSAARMLVSELSKFRPDIVFTDDAGYAVWYSRLYSLLRLHHIPFVAWLLGDIWTEHHWLFSTTRFPGNLLGPPRVFTWSAGLGLADRILTVSSWLKRIVADRFPRKSITVFHRGIEPEDWLVKETDMFDFERPAIGILQNNIILPKVKGLLWFSDVAKAMSDISFYVAGGGPYTHLVKKAYAGLKNVHFIGRLNYPEEVRRFYESTDLFVHASGLDTGPNTVLEAALCERAVVASRVGGVPERIVEGETGWTIPNGETDLWIAKISQLIDDEDLRRKMGSNGRNYVLKNFSWNIQASRLASIFRDTLASN